MESQSDPLKVKTRWIIQTEKEMSNPTANTSPKRPSTPPPQYEEIEENIYLIERKDKGKKHKELRRMVCDCILTKDERAKGKRGCSDDCLNRMMMIECGSRCGLGDLCLNKRFQRREYANVEAFRTHKKGWGLRTLTDLPSNAFIMEYVGEVVGSREFKKRVKEYSKLKYKHHYFMALRNKEIIDATEKGNRTRFINHSCDPNCETQKWTVNGELRIGFFSKRALNAGEEITFDYQFQRYGKKAQKCYCETEKCRGYIGNQESSSITLSKEHSSSKHRSKRDIAEHKENHKTERKARKKVHDSENDDSNVDDEEMEDDDNEESSNEAHHDDNTDDPEPFKMFRIPRVERTERFEQDVKTTENDVDSSNIVANGNGTAETKAKEDKFILGTAILKAKPIETIGQTTYHREGFPIKRLGAHRHHTRDVAPSPPKISKEERRKLFEWQVYMKEYKEWWDKYGMLITYNQLQQKQDGAQPPPHPTAPQHGPQLTNTQSNHMSKTNQQHHHQHHNDHHNNYNNQNQQQHYHDHQSIINPHQLHEQQPIYEHSLNEEQLLEKQLVDQQQQMILEQQVHQQQQNQLPAPRNLIPLVNEEDDFHLSIDNELAACLCDYDQEAYQTTADRLTEDIVSDPEFPCSGSYYTTPDGDSWFTSVLYNRHTHQVSAVTIYTGHRNKE